VGGIKLNPNNKLRIIDSHIHIRGTENAGVEKTLKGITSIKEQLGLEAINVAAIPQWDPDSVAQNLLCILFKALNPGSYAYGGLDYYYSGLKKDKDAFLNQAKELIEMGFDGIKSIEAKPPARKLIDIPLDSPLYDKYYDYIESNELPMLWHVGDPADNWIEEKCSDWLKNAGWYYGDGSFVSLEQLYAEVDNVLTKFPRLKAVFAHFYFMSADIDRAAAFLDKHPSVYFDITPGVEMIYNFDSKRSEWRDFFIRYQDRIIFGTDSGWGDEESPAQKVIKAHWNVSFMRAFYETDDVVEAWNNIKVRGLALPQEVCQKIYRENFMRVLKAAPPKPVNLKAALEYTERVYAALQTNEAKSAVVKQTKDALDILKGL
jgi:predicted TIM-barrel fold metal-dependent hydrolase